MPDLPLILVPLLLAGVCGALAAKQKHTLIAGALILASILPPLAEWYGLIWYRTTFYHPHPMLEMKTRAVTAAICQIQMILSLIIASTVFAVFWRRRRFSSL